MKILWITNITFPEAQQLLTGKGALKSSGGWMLGAAEALVKQPDLRLYVASISRRITKLTRLEGKHITYYILPGGWRGFTRVNHGLEPYWRTVRDEVKPDVVHLHGTEYTHGLAYLEACGAEHVCVSIQGLVSAYNYYYYGLTRWDILRAATFRSILFGGILSGYGDFARRADTEKDIIRRVSHIIGRTSWDRDRTWAINPVATYHYCGEILRPEFYSGETWNYERCTPHSIFLSQGGYPLKGLHMVLRAMPLVLRHYPDATIRIAGSDITYSRAGWRRFFKMGDYGNIIRKLIKKYNLQKYVTFTGSLDAYGMKAEYLRANVFVCPSSIENSPNSLGEAQILGVPVLASYVGGIPDMMRGDEEHLYRFEEVEMLAHKIVKLFDKKDASAINKTCQEATRRHDTQLNLSSLMDIYHSLTTI